MKLPDLYEPPLSRFGDDAIERWFTQEQIETILSLTETLTV